MASTTCELIWLKSLLQDMGFQPLTPIPLLCDNQAATHIASNPVFHERTKHIEVDCHFVREKVQANIICTPYIPSENQLADIFTKGVHKSRLMEILSKLGSIDIFSPT